MVETEAMEILLQKKENGVAEKGRPQDQANTWSFLFSFGRIFIYEQKKMGKNILVCCRGDGYCFYGDLDHSAGILDSV